MIANEETTDIEEFDPAREIQDARDTQNRVPAGLRSCKSCIHASVCKIFEVEAIHAQRLAELAKRSNVELDIFEPEAIGARCGAYKAVTE